MDEKLSLVDPDLTTSVFISTAGTWNNEDNARLSVVVLTERNPKAPDFKHKDTGEALWIDSRSSPPWVKSQLDILDMRMGSYTSQNTRMPVDMVSANEMLSF
ncbi:hypothetical protein TSUD_26300 [Trifolium subterraneum]|uniref:Uncharacterized protein n=1 Tax=Trifolium subterraneum TaxID=3900 RepID=A0A2Z6P3Y5_TRISU|nr:hypothetical protein TSUD_26300 [Trifolium subterraneum]